MKTPRSAVNRVVEACFQLVGVKQATVYVSENHIVRATALHPMDARSRSNSLVVTIGKPNFREREFIKTCQKAGEPLPVRKVQLKFWPKKR
jgi:hypothetical protein